jgi:serine phosphatase RsbU (regulator of sigma subunit)
VTRPERLSPVLGYLSAVAVLLVFILAAFSIRNAVDRNLTFQRELRLAQVDRARLLRFQIDEETGVRGYTDTKMPLFLAPYTAALRTFGPAAAQLGQRLPRLAVDATPLRDEIDLNRQWLRTVAAPLIRNPGNHELIATQVEGKRLVDQFRSTDDILSNELDVAADIAEASTAQAVTETLVGAIVLGIVLAGLLTWLSAAQRRLAFEVELQRQAYLEEKRIADALQEAFLQKSLPEVARAELHAVYVPAGRESRVGGDWYDAFELSEDLILFSIGDVAGHGIEAAVVMSRVRQALLSVGIEERDPAVVLARANEILLMQDGTIVTAICGVIDLAHGVIRLANAGHPPALIRLPNGEIETIGATGPPLGALYQPEYTVTSTWISSGSLLALYTDGLIEYGRDWDEGERRLLDALRAIPADTVDPADTLMRKIFGSQAPVDDVAILTVSFRERLIDGQTERAAAADRARPILGRSPGTLLASAPPMLTVRTDS